MRFYLYFQGHEYTKNSYIATQGPLSNTIYDFWLMVRQNVIDFRSQRPADVSASVCIQKIVMLTNFFEKIRQKCEKYFPVEMDEEITIKSPDLTETTFFSDAGSSGNSFKIKNIGMIKKSGYTIRKLDVRYDTAESSDNVEAYHYWFHNWADHKCPKDVTALLNLSLDVLKEECYDFSGCADEKEELCKCGDSPKTSAKFVFPPLETQSVACPVKVSVSSPSSFSTENQFPPTIVHCSAGIGRTGCLIAILNGIKQLTNEQKVDVLGIVCNMRLNRGGMVQNSEQYELIHKVLCLYEQVCLPHL